MNEAKLLDGTEERRKWTRNGRRIRDALVEASSVIKLVGGMIGELSKLFLAAMGAGMAVYVGWQEFNADLARHATPPAMVKQKDAK